MCSSIFLKNSTQTTNAWVINTEWWKTVESIQVLKSSFSTYFQGPDRKVIEVKLAQNGTRTSSVGSLSVCGPCKYELLALFRLFGLKPNILFLLLGFPLVFHHSAVMKSINNFFITHYSLWGNATNDGHCVPSIITSHPPFQDPPTCSSCYLTF